MQVSFTALDYTSEDQFVPAEYQYTGSTESGWEITRNGKSYLKLGKGYRLLKTKVCGVCSTDLDRRFLPFPLPQVIGHELVAEDEHHNRFVVEINDTFEARGESPSDVFCAEGIPTHSPERKVLGIDRLPGGFGPYILAPIHAAIPFSGLDDKVAVLIEPFAASLQAVIASPPRSGDRVAVLGPRRLGSLVISALRAYRNQSGTDFHISALARHSSLLDLSLRLGADLTVDLRLPENSVENLANSFDILYDTTASVSGFESAMQMAKRELHLKTTNGQVMGGVSKMTELVVDELSFLPLREESWAFHWQNDHRINRNVYIAPSLFPHKDFLGIPLHIQVCGGSIEQAYQVLQGTDFEGKLPRFDLALVGTPEELDHCIRPLSTSEDSLVRPRGAILYHSREPMKKQNSLEQFLMAGKSIRTSRCGDFHKALELLKENPDVAKALQDYMFTHEFPPNDLPTAFVTAKTPQAVKVLIKHDSH